MMRAEAYLDRIGYRGPIDPTGETLLRLHRAHLLSVPFENLDIRTGRTIVLSTPGFYGKIVTSRRGGFCYELNGLFAWLLGELGFRVTLLSARVHSGDRLGEEFDHLTLLVEMEERWIADVGFGDSFIEPLPLLSGVQTEQQQSRYALEEAGDGWTLRRRRGEDAWEPSYAFSMTPRRLEEFADRCRYLQTSPESHFTRNTVCSLATEAGRITLSGRRLIVTDGEDRREREIASAEEYRSILRHEFGIDPEGLDAERLWDGGRPTSSCR